MGYKYGCMVTEVSEYRTTMTCSNCGNLNNIGKEKIHDCNHCGMKADRDENSAKTHLKLGIMEALRKERQAKKKNVVKKAVKKVSKSGSKTNTKKKIS